MKALIQLVTAIFKLAFNLLSLILNLFIKIFRYLAHRRTLYGTAKWNTGFSKWRLLSQKNDGFVIDGTRRISQKNSFAHLILAAPSGSGKTTRYVVPSVLREKNMSMVVTDPSGEIFDLTSGWMKSTGYKIKVFDARNPEKSLQFNPLHRCNDNSQIMQTVETLIRSAYPKSTADQAFWEDGAGNLLSILIRAAKAAGEEYGNLHNVRHLLNQFGNDGIPLLDFLTKNLDEHSLVEWKGIVSADNKVLMGFVATARACLNKFADEKMVQLTARESLLFEGLRTSKTILYIIVPEEQISYYSFLLSILYTQMFDSFLKMPTSKEKAIHFLLDEFGNMKIPNFGTIASVIRKRKCALSLIVQDYAQLEAIYGREGARTIISGACSSRLFYSGSSPEMSEYISKLLGVATIDHRYALDRSWTEKQRPLMTPDEVRRMDSDQGIYVFSNQPAVKLKVKPFYKQKELLRRSRMTPPEMPLREDSGVVYLDLNKDEEEESDIDFSH